LLTPVQCSAFEHARAFEAENIRINSKAQVNRQQNKHCSVVQQTVGIEETTACTFGQIRTNRFLLGMLRVLTCAAMMGPQS
jgi:hypothetical protein